MPWYDGHMRPSFKELIKSAATLLVLAIEDKVEEWGSRESRADLESRLRAATERGAQLAMEKAELRDKIDELRFNGPTLWRDEVEVLQAVKNDRMPHSQSEDTDQWIRATIAKLLDRCDHMPNTAEEMDAMARQAIDDVGAWNDPGKDVDEPCDHKDDYGSTMMDGTCMLCGHSDRDDAYEGSWREAADNEGAAIAAESLVNAAIGETSDDDIPF